MAEYTLSPHPDFPSVAVIGLRVTAQREHGALHLRFLVAGDLDRVRWPDRCREGRRADALWKETCFEAFVEVAGEPGYSELNFSPSGRWAAYSFDRYREGMRNLDVPGGPAAFTGYREPTDPGCEWGFGVAGAFDAASDWLLGLTAIIEATDGSKSYWALAHAPGPPDFHNRDCFIAKLPA